CRQLTNELRLPLRRKHLDGAPALVGCSGAGPGDGKVAPRSLRIAELPRYFAGKPWDSRVWRSFQLSEGRRPRRRGYEVDSPFESIAHPFEQARHHLRRFAELGDKGRKSVSIDG